MNLVLSHPTEKKFGPIPLRLLPPPVPSHPTKKFPVLSHPMKIKSGPVPSHENKTWSCPISLKKNLVLSHPTKKKSGPVPSNQKKTCHFSSYKKKFSSLHFLITYIDK